MEEDPESFSRSGCTEREEKKEVKRNDEMW